MCTLLLGAIQVVKLKVVSLAMTNRVDPLYKGTTEMIDIPP